VFFSAQQTAQTSFLPRIFDYWKPGRPYLDRIVARFVADSATRTAAIEKGEAHVGGFAAIPWPDVKTLAKLPTIETTTKGYEMSSPIVQLDFNTRKAPFDNLKVRQAVSYAVSRKAVIENVRSTLKPGGLYVIADHAGRPGTGITESGTLHRVEESFLRREVEAAGFRLLAEGDFLRNPGDPRDHNTPEPPQPKDEFVLKFVKP